MPDQPDPKIDESIILRDVASIEIVGDSARIDCLEGRLKFRLETGALSAKLRVRVESGAAFFERLEKAVPVNLEVCSGSSNRTMRVRGFLPSIVELRAATVSPPGRGTSYHSYYLAGRADSLRDDDVE